MNTLLTPGIPGKLDNLVTIQQKKLGTTLDKKYLRNVSNVDPRHPTKFFTVGIVQYSQLITVKPEATLLGHQIAAILPSFATIRLISNSAQGLQLGDKVMIPTFSGGITFSTLTPSK